VTFVPEEAVFVWIQVRMSITLLILGLPNEVTLKAETPAQACKSTVTRTLQMIPLESKVFGNKRLLRVWLPPGYSAPVAAAKRYPVLYLFDGQMLFDRCTSQLFQDEWRVAFRRRDLRRPWKKVEEIKNSQRLFRVPAEVPETVTRPD
jgi:hypothetical protein